MFLDIAIFLFMPRKPRIEYGGAVYHVVSRGNRSEGIYRDDTDRELFIEALTEVCERAGWIIHAYVLMDTIVTLIIYRIVLMKLKARRI